MRQHIPDNIRASIRGNAQHGTATMMTWMVMSLLLVGGIVSSGLRMTDLRTSGEVLRGKRGAYCAEVGLSYAASYLRANPGTWPNLLKNKSAVPGLPVPATVTISDDLDEVPPAVNNWDADSNDVILMSSTCTDGNSGSVVARQWLDLSDPGGDVTTGSTACIGAGCVGGKKIKKGDTVKLFGQTIPVTSFAGNNVLNVDGSLPSGNDFSSDGIKSIGVDLRDDMVKLSTTYTTLPFIWMSNSGQGTVSKINTDTGVELGRYRTGPGSASPSRTTVDLDGNVWVANRSNNTVTKIGLMEAGNCIDRNKNGKIDTSTGPTDVRAWTGTWGGGVAGAQDECILIHIGLSYPGVTTPGDVRMVTIDRNNYLFAGGLGTSGIYKIRWDGVIVAGRNSFRGHYGGLVDAENYVWSMSGGGGTAQKFSNNLASNWSFSISPVSGYGIATDKQSNIYYSEYGSRWGKMDKWGNGRKTWDRGICCGQGLAVSKTNEVWLSGSLSNSHVDRYRDNGQLIARYWMGGSGVTGVAVDAKGNIWSSNYYSSNTSRIDVATGRVDTFPIGANPYNYSDMTGFIARTFTARQGTWTVRQYCGRTCNSWKYIAWNAKSVPVGTTVTARARSAGNVLGLGAADWVPVQNGRCIPKPPGGDANNPAMAGRVIEVEIKLTTETDGVTPEVDKVVILSHPIVPVFIPGDPCP